MTAHPERGTKRYLKLLVAALVAVAAGGGCRQKMAEQPYYKPYEPTEFFQDEKGQPQSSARPLERGVIHRGQRFETDPLVTGLTADEWGRAFAQQVLPKFDAAVTTPTPIENRAVAVGAPRFDPPGFDAAKYGGTPHPGPQIFVNEFPFEIKPDDLKRGMERYTIYCAVCHGPLGNGQGKIWERGYLTPTSFHTNRVSAEEVEVQHPADLPLGYSRGFGLWGIKIPLREVPVGYYYEVITKGYAGMPSYSAQIPPADRWRIIAYIKTLQFSQHADPGRLPPDLKAKLDAGGKP